MSWKERIQTNPQICHGKPCIRGTRVMVATILDNLADGESVENITQGFGIDQQDVFAALAYAADLAAERVVNLPLEVS